MSVTMDEMTAKIEAGEARGETKLERAINGVRTEIADMRSEMHQEHLRLRVWFLVTAIFIVASTVSILSYLDYGRNPSQAPVIINVPSGQIEQMR